MACACTAGKKNVKLKVLLPNGTLYKTYTSQIEADAAAKRVNGTVVKG